MEKNKKIKITLVILGIFAMVMTVSLSFAYFMTVVNNDDRMEATVVTGTMALTFKDNDAGINANLTHGQSVVKKFTIENTGTRDAYAGIYFKDLVNTYTSGSFTYDLEYSEIEDGAYTKVITDKKIQNGSIPFTTGLAENQLIPARKKYYYNLIIKLNYLDDLDQTGDFNAKFSTNLTLDENGKQLAVSDVVETLNITAKEGAIDPEYNGNLNTFSLVENYHETTQTYNVKAEESDLYIVYADSYNYDKNTGKFDLVEPQTVKYSENYTNLNGKYIRYANPYARDGEKGLDTLSFTSLSHVFKVTDATYDELEKTGTVSFIDFYRTPDYDNGEIRKIEDDYGTSYVFRGNIQNNYVKFANKYWRIMRINGDGTMRLVYDGTNAHENFDNSTDRMIGTSSFNKENKILNSNTGIGYMYGNYQSITFADTHKNTNDSSIKDYLDTWYEENLLSNNIAIADALFCNDRTISEGDGIGQNATTYSAVNRVENNTPRLTCPNKEDRFTVSDDTLGNASLKYPIGLLTADEYMLLNTKNYNNYMFRGKNYWTMTPAKTTNIIGTPFAENYYAMGFLVKHGGGTSKKCASMYYTHEYTDSYSAPEKTSLSSTYGSIIIGGGGETITTCAGGVSYDFYKIANHTSLYVLPVINIKAEYISTMTGTGTMLDPYVINV